MKAKKKIFKREKYLSILFKRFLITLLIAILALSCTVFFLDNKAKRSFEADCYAAVTSCVSSLENALYENDREMAILPKTKTILCGAAEAMESKGYKCYISLPRANSTINSKPYSDSAAAVKVFAGFDNEITDTYYSDNQELMDFINSVRMKYLGNDEIYYLKFYSKVLATLPEISAHERIHFDENGTPVSLTQLFFLPKEIYLLNQCEFEVPEVTAVIRTIDPISHKILNETHEVQTFETSKAKDKYYKVATDYYNDLGEITSKSISSYNIPLSTLKIFGPSTSADFFAEEDSISMYEKEPFISKFFDSRFGGTTYANFYVYYNRLEGNLTQYIKISILYLILSMIVAFIWAFGVHNKNKQYFAMEDYRKNLLNCLAHDLKTPLTVMTGYAQNLLENVHSEKKEHYASSIVENAEYMNSLIENILSLSKTETDIKLNLEETDLIQLTEKLWAKYKEAAEEKELAVSFNGTLPRKVDISLISCALDNLLTNAVRYSKPGTQILISEENGAFVISNTPEKPVQKKAEDLWKPFEKEDISRKNQNGSGLGLSIVKNILEIHGFKPSLETDENTFTVKF